MTSDSLTTVRVLVFILLAFAIVSCSASLNMGVLVAFLKGNELALLLARSKLLLFLSSFLLALEDLAKLSDLLRIDLFRELDAKSDE